MIAFQLVALVDRVAYECNVSRDEILGTSRARDPSRARAISVYCARRLWGTSYPKLAEVFRRSTAGVQYLQREAENLVDSDRTARRIVARITEEEGKPQ